MTDSARMGRYRYWGDQKPDTKRPLLTFTRAETVAPPAREAVGDPAPAAETVATGTLRIYGPIDSWGGWWGVSAQDVARALDLLGPVDRVVVRINSPGGEAFEGRAIMNMLRAHQAECIGVVDGLAASAASYIAVGCDETVMAPGTTLMIHDTHSIVYGDAATLRKEAAVLDSISNSGAELYADVAGGTPEDWRQKQRETTWYTAAEAVAAGLAARVAVVPDAGPAETAADDTVVEIDPEQDRVDAEYDLALVGLAREQADTGSIPKPPNASAVGSTTPQEGSTAVAFSDEQLTTMRKDLGLPETADEATIVAAMSEALAERADSSTTTTPKVPEGMALVESSVLNELRTGAQAGREAREQQRSETRDRVISDAIAAGKTMPARREHWQKAWDADPEGTQTLLESLEPGLVVPTEETGHANEPKPGEFTNIDDASLDAYAAQLGLTKEDLRG